MQRAVDLVVDLPDDVEASESWSDEDPSEAGEAESAVLGARKAGGRCTPVGRRADGALGTGWII